MTEQMITLSLAAKLGGIAVHAEELISPKGHEFDKAALETLLQDEEVKEFLDQLSALALLPVKR